MSLHLNPHFTGHVPSIKVLVETPAQPGALLLGPVSGLGARLLHWAQAAPTTRLHVLMSGLPPQADFDHADRLSLRLGVYLPNEKRTTKDTLLGLPETDNAKSIQLLKKFAAVGRRPFVLADCNAVQDPLHYAELIRTLTDQLLVLGEETHPARARTLYEAWHRTKV